MAWVLNFDAERELEADGAPSMASAAVRARHAEIVRHVTGENALVRHGDVVIDPFARPAVPLRDAHAFVGDAWCPTPSACAALRAAGVTPPPAPSLAVLRRVNGRGFAARLGQTLLDAVFATSVDDALHAIARAAPTAVGDWLVKRPFGFAGRGRRKVHAGELSPSDRAWVEASFVEGDADGGLQIEPWVTRAGDFALHGRIDASWGVTFGALTRQLCDAQGAWRGTARATDDDLDAAERDALFATARATADALVVAGYFGPFGIDAFRWKDARVASGATQFNTRSEINARYSMGWSVGMNGG